MSIDKTSPAHEGNAGLEQLTLNEVRPAKHISLYFSPRLNIITGDNGLGKTFLLDCAWWALSGTWADPDQPAYPRLGATQPAIEFRMADRLAYPQRVLFNKSTQNWPRPSKKPHVLPGIVMYARINGSYLIWDPSKHAWPGKESQTREPERAEAISFSQNDIWDGLDKVARSGKKHVICNGLIRDWITWQYRPATGTFATFSRILEKLSPHPKGFMVPGSPVKLPNDDREIPTLQFPYGEVPVLLLSAGIKRIVSLAYLLVWTWEGHKAASQDIGQEPQSKMVFLIDEMEAHLHPQWQRVVVPALLDVVKVLEQQLDVQLIIATHSPLVMASVEPLFQTELDRLFTLDLVNQELEAKAIQYVKQGSINSWLTSEAFHLQRPYSIDKD